MFLVRHESVRRSTKVTLVILLWANTGTDPDDCVVVDGSTVVCFFTGRTP